MTKGEIIEEIHKLKSAGVVLRAGVIYPQNKNLCFEAFEKFGSVEDAVRAAGYKYPQNTPEEIERFRSLIKNRKEE